MAEKMVFSMRFHMDNTEDRKLYELLKQDAGDVMSLAAVAKGRIRDSYHAEKRMEENVELLEQIKEVVREEMQVSGMKMVGAMLAGMKGTGGIESPIPQEHENRLPRAGGELPRSALDFLDR